MSRSSTRGRLGIRRLRGDSSGAVIIEFAFITPILLLILFGTIDFGFLFREYQVVTNAAREGARMAVLPGYTTDDVVNRVNGFLTASGLTPSAAPVVTENTFTPGGGMLPFTTKVVTVQVEHTFFVLGPIAALTGGSFLPVTLIASSEMRTEVAAGGL